MVGAQTQPLFTTFTDAWAAANGPEGGFTIPGAHSACLRSIRRAEAPCSICSAWCLLAQP